MSIVVLFVILSFRPCFDAGFVNLDDDVLVTGNPQIKSLSAKSVAKMFLAPYNGLYHPLVTLSYAVERRIFGLDPAVYHTTNLLLHVFNTLLVFWMLFLLKKDVLFAALGALFFGIHPVHVESVAWISERKDVLYGFFFLGSLVFYLRYVLSAKRVDFAFSLVFFVLSLFSKSMAVSLPLVIVLIDVYSKRSRDKKVIMEKLPFLAVALVFGALALLVHYVRGPRGGAPSIDPAAAVIEASNNILFYAVKFFHPSGLSVHYPYSGAGWSGFFGSMFAALPLIAILTVISIRLFKHNRLAVFGAFFYVLAILPASQIIPFGQKVPADRYNYIPSIGLLMLALELLWRFYAWRTVFNRVKKAVVVFAVFFLAIYSSNATFNRCLVWEDSIILWNDVIRKHPYSARAYKFRADAYKDNKEYEKAFVNYAKAIELKEDYAESYNNRGNLYNALGRHADAVADFTKAVEILPGYTDAVYNRALAWQGAGKPKKALEDYSHVIMKDPGHAAAFNNRGVLLARMGDMSGAVRDFNSAVCLDPEFDSAYLNRALALYELGDHEGARRDARRLAGRRVKLPEKFVKKLLKEQRKMIE